jgi:hypothetical protein
MGEPSAAAPEPAAPPVSAPPASAPPAAPKKSNALKFVLLGCLGLVILGVLGIVATTFFIRSKMQQAGIDTELMQRNPALATAKMIVAANPDLELVNYDESSQKLTIRQKSTGKVTTLDLEDVKNGRIVFQEEGKGEVEISAQGDRAVVKTPEGTSTFGASDQPDWLPKYTRVTEGGGFSASIEGGKQGTFTFKTPDTVEQVVSFYEREMPGKGFEIKKTATMRQGPIHSEVLEATGNNRKVRFSVMRMGEETTVSIGWE